MKTQPWNTKLHYDVFLLKLKQKNFFDGIEYDQLCPSGSAPARIYDTLKIQTFSPRDSFPNIRVQKMSCFLQCN